MTDDAPTFRSRLALAPIEFPKLDQSIWREHSLETLLAVLEELKNIPFSQDREARPQECGKGTPA